MANKKTVWTMERRAVTDLAPADYNPRKLSEKAKADLMESITRFGQVEPIVVNANGTIIGGHQRVIVYADLGIAETDVMIPDRQLSKDEEKELNLRLNKNVGEWDWMKIKEFFEIDELLDAGFGADEISAAFDKLAEAHEDDFDADAEAQKIIEPTTKTGEMYALGEHRLICGDSTDPAVFERLFGNEKADACFTDPPYNVNYDYQTKYGGIHKSRKKSFAGGSKVFNDNKTEKDFEAMLFKMFTNVYNFSKDSCGIYVCHATKSQEQFFRSYKDAGWHFSQTIIWLKERIILALGQDFHRVYEPIMYGWKKGKKRWSNKSIPHEKEVWDIDKATFEERLDVWYLHRDKSSDYEHPTQKPVRLPERAIKKSCPVGGVVVDPFGGSGSTLIACEQLGRKCFMAELDPRYCDVIIKRYERFTGKWAEKLS